MVKKKFSNDFWSVTDKNDRIRKKNVDQLEKKHLPSRN